jgi:hypothetical protein
MELLIHMLWWVGSGTLYAGIYSFEFIWPYLNITVTTVEVVPRKLWCYVGTVLRCKETQLIN